MPNEMTAAEIAGNLEEMAILSHDVESVKQAAAILRRVASGELRPVVHGRWIPEIQSIRDGYDYSHVPTYTCSHCRHEEEYKHPSYCPSCGCLMDGKGDENAK